MHYGWDNGIQKQWNSKIIVCAGVVSLLSISYMPLYNFDSQTAHRSLKNDIVPSCDMTELGQFIIHLLTAECDTAL